MSLQWTEDELPDGWWKKRLFGGTAYYLDEKLVLITFEKEGSNQAHGVCYDFDVWNGCMFPVEKALQHSIQKEFPFLISHPVLPKWLYIPAQGEDFEDQVKMILRQIRRRRPEFGCVPKSKASATLQRKQSEKREPVLDTRRPRMFSDEPIQEIRRRARRISDLKNLGPESEKAFVQAGIKTPEKLFQLGWKKAMIELVKVDSKHGHSIFAYAVIGALQNKIWNGISDRDKAAARAFMKSLRSTASEPHRPSAKKKTVTKKKRPGESKKTKKTIRAL